MPARARREPHPGGVQSAGLLLGEKSPGPEEWPRTEPTVLTCTNVVRWPSISAARNRARRRPSGDRRAPRLRYTGRRHDPPHRLCPHRPGVFLPVLHRRGRAALRDLGLRGPERGRRARLRGDSSQAQGQHQPAPGGDSHTQHHRPHGGRGRRRRPGRGGVRQQLPGRGLGGPHAADPRVLRDHPQDPGRPTGASWRRPRPMGCACSSGCSGPS